MVFFVACDNLGQAIGGVTAGLVLAVGSYPSVGELVFVICFVAIWLSIASRRLLRPATIAIGG